MPFLSSPSKATMLRAIVVLLLLLLAAHAPMSPDIHSAPVISLRALFFMLLLHLIAGLRPATENFRENRGLPMFGIPLALD